MHAQISQRPYVQIEPYEGPLDLLLYLVRRDGIDIRALPIAHITREYLAFLDQMERHDLDVAGDFLVMAATLCELKSRELLPRAERPVDEPEEEDPREALIRRMLEHQRYYEVAASLADRLWLGRDVFARPPTQAADESREITAGTDAFGLLEMLERMGRRKHKRTPHVHEVESESESLKACVHRVVDQLADGRSHRFDEMVMHIERRSTRVMTFLAVLELARLRIISIAQKAHLFPLFLKAAVPAEEADLSAITEAS